MAFGPRHFVTPVAAFTMAVTVIFYVKYTISTARSEAHIRRMGELSKGKPQPAQSNNTSNIEKA